MQMAREDEGPTASMKDARKSSSVHNWQEMTRIKEGRMSKKMTDGDTPKMAQLYWIKVMVLLLKCGV